MYGCIFLETICKKFKRNIKLMSNCELMKWWYKNVLYIKRPYL
jgi:hypothetical protein